MSDDRAFLKAADLGPLLGVTTGRVYQLIAAGVIPAIRIGGALRVPRDAWEAWLKQQRKRALTTARRTRDKDGPPARAPKRT